MHTYWWVASLLAGLLTADSHKVPRRCSAAGWCLPLWGCNLELPCKQPMNPGSPKLVEGVTGGALVITGRRGLHLVLPVNAACSQRKLLATQHIYLRAVAGGPVICTAITCKHCQNLSKEL